MCHIKIMEAHRHFLALLEGLMNILFLELKFSAYFDDISEIDLQILDTIL